MTEELVLGHPLRVGVQRLEQKRLATVGAVGGGLEALPPNRAERHLKVGCPKPRRRHTTFAGALDGERSSEVCGKLSGLHSSTVNARRLPSGRWDRTGDNCPSAPAGEKRPAETSVTMLAGLDPVTLSFGRAILRVLGKGTRNKARLN